MLQVPSSQRKTPLILNKLIHNFLELFPQGSVPVTMKLRFTFLLVLHSFLLTVRKTYPIYGMSFVDQMVQAFAWMPKNFLPCRNYFGRLHYLLACPVRFCRKIKSFSPALRRASSYYRTGPHDCEIIWQRKAPEVEIEKFHASSSPATPTPFVEQNRLYVLVPTDFYAMTTMERNSGKNHFPLQRAFMGQPAPRSSIMRC